jgi:hypothetical protein
MSYIDDLVKLNYLKPMREGAESALGNITTYKSKDVLQNFLTGVQTNEDGTAKTGSAQQLDLNNPDFIRNLMSREMGAMGKLTEISGGKTNTPEMQNIQSISDRIMKGYEGSSQAKYREAQAKALQLGYGGRGTAAQETSQGLQNSVIQNDDSLVKQYKSALMRHLDDFVSPSMHNTADLSLLAVKETHPDWSENKIKAEADKVNNSIMDDYTTKTQMVNTRMEDIAKARDLESHKSAMAKDLLGIDSEWGKIERELAGNPIAEQNITSRYGNISKYKEQFYKERIGRLSTVYPELAGAAGEPDDPILRRLKSANQVVPPSPSGTVQTDRNAPDWVKSPRDANSIINPQQPPPPAPGMGMNGEFPAKTSATYMEQFLQSYQSPVKKDATDTSKKKR